MATYKRGRKLSQKRRNVLARERREARAPQSPVEEARRVDFVRGEAEAPGPRAGEVLVGARLHSQLQDPPELASLQTVAELDAYLAKTRMKVCLLRLIPLAANSIGALDPEEMRDASDWVEAAGEAAR